ncbi:branched-subunit amino acid transport system permease [Gibbsiella quercinecans]|uniref:Uncharacterized protein n=1 Tax=Gibbsiella quercinecans TaxID=929813 RepID=A0A250AYS7_9GAMM|nr:hypothetical protein [Gibbsiella quercinecans]ATA19067.1 hypothetical protein AWC35_06740 [Gibbsiella quercinecans]RLM03643.1 hypothetical protein BIY30_21900 [Gibbsiella quercinecans]RLM07729.1 hypothetical protein BIY31_12890 [Gibbsiella quercinecans]TCT82018.1 branched-subunit amino acid transport system permease [Gibbsiella quercinecans]
MGRGNAIVGVIKRTDTGIALYAIGADDTAAGLSGIGVKWARCKAFILAGGMDLSVASLFMYGGVMSAGMIGSSGDSMMRRAIFDSETCDI